MVLIFLSHPDPVRVPRTGVDVPHAASECVGPGPLDGEQLPWRCVHHTERAGPLQGQYCLAQAGKNSNDILNTYKQSLIEII